MVSAQFDTESTPPQELPWWESLLSNITDNVWSECVSSTAAPATSQPATIKVVDGNHLKVMPTKSKFLKNKRFQSSKRGSKEDPPELSLISGSSSSHALIDDTINEEDEEDDELVSLADTAAFQSKIYTRNIIQPVVSFISHPSSHIEPSSRWSISQQGESSGRTTMKCNKIGPLIERNNKKIEGRTNPRVRAHRKESDKLNQVVSNMSTKDTLSDQENYSSGYGLKFISPTTARKLLFTTPPVDEGRLDEDGTQTPTIFKEARRAVEARESYPMQDITFTRNARSGVQNPRPIRVSTSNSSDDFSLICDSKKMLLPTNSGDISEANSAFVSRRRRIF
mmetsp:Transcript_42020/g.82405  ORF Transcript_42020/g.82405 Transcript_42020/m.82405 type:complete len:338 (+) Transcript_42020:87-1100(+)